MNFKHILVSFVVTVVSVAIIARVTPLRNVVGL